MNNSDALSNKVADWQSCILTISLLIKARSFLMTLQSFMALLIAQMQWAQQLIRFSDWLYDSLNPLLMAGSLSAIINFG